MNIDNIPGVQETRDFINERLKNPFLSSLAFFWFLFNWQIPFYVIFSNHPIEGRFDYINDELWTFWRSVLLPIIFSFGYYYLRDKFFNYLEKDTKDAFIERKITATDKEVELIRLETKKEKELVKLSEIRARNQEIDQLRLEKENLNQSIETLKISIKEQQDNFNKMSSTNKKLESDKEKFVGSFHFFLAKLYNDKSLKERFLKLEKEDFVSIVFTLQDIMDRYRRTIDNQIDSNKIVELEKMGVGEFKINEGVLDDIKLSTFGVFMLFYYVFTQSGLSSLNLKFLPNDIYKFYPHYRD